MFVVWVFAFAYYVSIQNSDTGENPAGVKRLFVFIKNIHYLSETSSSLWLELILMFKLLVTPPSIFFLFAPECKANTCSDSIASIF